MTFMKPLTIGVSGGTGSGKTTVTRALMSAVGPDNVAFLPEDAYYRDYSHLPVEERYRVNWDHPDAIETDLLIRHVRSLVDGFAVERPEYDFRNYTRLARPLALNRGL